MNPAVPELVERLRAARVAQGLPPRLTDEECARIVARRQAEEAQVRPVGVESAA